VNLARRVVREHPRQQSGFGGYDAVCDHWVRVCSRSLHEIICWLDDGFIPQAPYRDWRSESGAPWPYEDEFHVGCTLEHAGYYLSWLIAMFGPVRRVVAAAAETIPDKPGAGGTADFSVATLMFDDGPPVRLTCSITASHDHTL